MPKKKASKTPVKSTANCCTNCDPSVHPVHRVTPLSKGLAAVLFITLPIIAFMIGSAYQRDLDMTLCSDLSAFYQEK